MNHIIEDPEYFALHDAERDLNTAMTSLRRMQLDKEHCLCGSCKYRALRIKKDSADCWRDSECDKLEEAANRLIEKGEVDFRFPIFLLKARCALQRASDAMLPVLTVNLEHTSAVVDRVYRLEVLPTEAFARSLRQQLLCSGDPELEKKALHIVYAMNVAKRLVGRGVDIAYWGHRDRLATVTAEINALVDEAKQVEIQDDMFTFFTKCCHKQLLLPGSYYFSSKNNDDTDGLVIQPRVGMRETDMIQDYHGIDRGEALFKLCSKPVDKHLAGERGGGDAEEHKDEGGGGDRWIWTRESDEVLPTLTRTVCRDVAFLTVFASQYECFNSDAFVKHHFVFASDPCLMKKAKPGQKRPKVIPYVVSVFTGGDLKYCVCYNGDTVSCGGKLLFGLDEALALWLVVCEDEHKNVLPSGMVLSEFREALANPERQ